MNTKPIILDSTPVHDGSPQYLIMVSHNRKNAQPHSIWTNPEDAKNVRDILIGSIMENDIEIIKINVNTLPATEQTTQQIQEERVRQIQTLYEQGLVSESVLIQTLQNYLAQIPNDPNLTFDSGYRYPRDGFEGLRNLTPDMPNAD